MTFFLVFAHQAFFALLAVFRTAHFPSLDCRFWTIIIITVVLRPFFHTKARDRRYQQLNYSTPTYSMLFVDFILDYILAETPSVPNALPAPLADGAGSLSLQS